MRTFLTTAGRRAAGKRPPLARRWRNRTASLFTAALAGGGLLTLLATGPTSAQTAGAAAVPAPAHGTTPSVALFTPADGGNEAAYLAYTGTGGAAYVRNIYGPTVALGGHLIGGPAVVLTNVLTQNQDELIVFGRGTDNALWWDHQTASGAWTGWHSLGGVLTSKPGAAAAFNGDHGKLAAFVRGTDGQIWYRSLGTSGWQSWKAIGGNLLRGTAPSAAYEDNGHLVLAVVGVDQRVWMFGQFSGFGFAEGVLGGRTTSDPGIAFVDGTHQQPNARLAVVFVRGTDNALWYKQVSLPVTTVNGAWHSLGGRLTSGPAADSVGLTYLFALGTDNQAWMRHGAWPALSGWTRP